MDGSGIKRVKDSVAEQAVQSGKAEYVAKAVWKTEVRGPVEPTPVNPRKKKSWKEKV